MEGLLSTGPTPSSFLSIPPNQPLFTFAMSAGTETDWVIGLGGGGRKEEGRGEGGAGEGAGGAREGGLRKGGGEEVECGRERSGGVI